MGGALPFYPAFSSSLHQVLTLALGTGRGSGEGWVVRDDGYSHGLELQGVPVESSMDNYMNENSFKGI